MTFRDMKTIYAVLVYVSLAAFDNIIIGLFPPLFSEISKDLHVDISAMGVVSAINILATSVSAILWGYLSGRFNRKKLIIFGTIIWVAAVYLTSTSTSYLELLFFQILTGVGLGCIASIGFSALTDFVPYNYRGMILSFWGMSQGLGGIIGALLASLISTETNWRMPFETLSIVGLVLIIFYFFVEEPRKGRMEPELQALINNGKNYNYRIKINQLFDIISKKSNLLLFFQGFFMNIATGSLIWLPTLYISKIQALGYSSKIAIIAAAFLFGIFQLGGITSSFFGYLGDVLQRKTYKGRSLMTAFFVLATMPLYILLFIFPMNHLSFPHTTNSIAIFFHLVGQIFTNPWIMALFIISFLASAAQSANTPNWLALITDVNLPEHRGAVFSIANFSNSLGRTVGNLGIGALLMMVSLMAHHPNDYVFTLIILQLSLIPSALCYVIMAKHNVTDISYVKETLDKRGKIV